MKLEVYDRRVIVSLDDEDVALYNAGRHPTIRGQGDGALNHALEFEIDEEGAEEKSLDALAYDVLASSLSGNHPVMAYFRRFT